MLSIGMGVLVSDGRLSNGIDVITPAVGAMLPGSTSWVMSTDWIEERFE
jgi:hypothetical protein